MTNSRADAHKSWMVRSFPSQSIKALHPALYNKYNLYLLLRYWEAVVRSYSVKKMFLKFCKIHRYFLWHRSFLWTLRHFKEHLFSWNTSSGCFWDLHERDFLFSILYIINQPLRLEHAYFLSIVELKTSFSQNHFLH